MYNKGKIYRKIGDKDITNIIIDESYPNGFTIQVKPLNFWKRFKDSYKLFVGRSIHYKHDFGNKESVNDFCEKLLCESNEADGMFFEVEKLHDSAILPKKAHPGDSGFDVATHYSFSLNPGYQAMIKLGYRIRIKPGYEIQMRSRSSLPTKYNCLFPLGVGTIDCFSEDMKILTINGEKRINDLRINDVCLSVNNNFEIEKDTIVAIVYKGKREILKIETEDGILEVTPNTEIYTKEGIKYAKDLNENDDILFIDINT